VKDLLFLTLEFELQTDRSKEGFKVVEEIFLSHSQVEVEEEKELSFHQVDFCQAEAKALITLHACIPGPVLVLWARVIQIFGRQDKRGQENAVDGAAHALGNWWESGSKSLEVHKRCH
jgi:hypothetical protein